MLVVVFFFQAEDGIRDLVRSRGLGDVYKRQVQAAALKDHSIVRCTQLPRRTLLRSGVRARSGEIPGADGRDARCGEDEKVRRP